VADVVGARSRRGLDVALGQLEGKLSREIDVLREDLLDFRAEIEATIDFDEDLDTGDAARAGRVARGHAERLLERSELGVALREGVAVAIVGRPNVGKSSLLNALLDRDRAIVTSLAGTTRDAIEEEVDIAGVGVRLIDTAGWGRASGPAEEAALDRARAAAAGAELVLLVVDASVGLTPDDLDVAGALDPGRTIAVFNKIDLGEAVPEKESLGGTRWCGTVPVSALTGEGVDALRELVGRAVIGTSDEGPVFLSNLRHIDALRRVVAALDRALELVESGAAGELAAIEVAEAAQALGEVTGETTQEAVLARIFERFCVGK
jgi:tRNA modification GTPase